ncbi:MAG: GEGP motif-containing diheme protein [Spirochaetia bacterium]|jgi:hypothetical protein
MRTPRSVISLCALLIAAFLSVLLTGCPAGSSAAAPLVSTRAYSGHENDQDANNFVRAYPAKVGSRLDDCQLCHKVGATAPKTLYNPCSYCHLIQWPDPTNYSPTPVNYQATLNQFGLDYLNNGRTIAAFSAIASMDSDGDGATNIDEINDNRFPGSAASKPGQPFAPTISLTMSQVQTMTQHPEFLLMNTSKQQYDDYATYTGPTVKDVLVAAGVDLTGATGVSVFAPDGFKQDFLIAKVNNSPAYPDTVFYEVPQPFTDPRLNFVNYPSPLPTCPSTGTTYKNGDPITGLQLTVAWKRDGNVLSTSYYDPATGTLQGEGPFRVIPPQSTAGRPDRGSGSTITQASPDDGWNYLGSLDHNAGSSPRGACIIRVNPMPAGLEEYDTSNGWSLISDKKIVIYGLGVH